MKIRIIDNNSYENFVRDSKLNSFYQSLEWFNFKDNENKKVELLGLFENDTLVGVSLVVYARVLKRFYMAYASRGFIYDYKNIKGFKDAILDYFKDKKVIFFKMDPPIILASYDPDLKKCGYNESQKIIDELKEVGFEHFGYNMAYETEQFRFIHRIKLESNFNEQLNLMNKSTRKNIEQTDFRGARAREVSSENLDDVLYFFELTSKRKNFNGLSKRFYLNLIDSFKDNINMYIIYIDKKIYMDNLKSELNSLDKELNALRHEMECENVGKKLKAKEEMLLNKQIKYTEELKSAKDLDDITDIGSILSITKYNEIIAFGSGMDNNYRMFKPKYVMYPELMKLGISKNLEYINFLGVKNILDKNDSDYGIYEVKRGFGGETIEYIGEFDLPINNFWYKVYKLINKNN